LPKLSKNKMNIDLSYPLGTDHREGVYNERGKEMRNEGRERDGESDG
jgi:hypothetical protein